MAERERMIKQVETTVGEVNEIFTDLASLVSEQSVHIDNIASTIENTAAQSSRAADELRTAARAQGRMRGRMCCLVMAVVAPAALFLMMSMSASSAAD